MTKTDGSLLFDTKLSTKDFETGIEKMKSFAAKGAAAIGTAVAAGIGAAVKLGMDFEAAMSKVGSISMASAEDMQVLTDKAKEMGEKTVFSASQAADAFSYMAMAGWKTEEMTSGIEGIMNLAAASGENLASTSDIVTDALTAFGLTAADSTHFADVLAAASSNANTNVALMGETFKYAAPVAGALGYSVEDVSLAVGLMANSGVKASQAGTSLRTLFTNMAKPTDQVAKAMTDLNISATDSSGAMKPLSQLMEELRGKFDNLTAAQKTEYAAMLAGKMGMSGLLAIVNASDKDFDKLSSAINNAGGMAKEMADRNLDNLKGQLTLAGSAAEGLAICVYDGIEAPLKSAVKEGTSKISELTQAFKNGELSGALANVGKMLGDLVKGTVNLTTVALPPLIKTLSFVSYNFGSLLTVMIGAKAAIAGYNSSAVITTSVTKAWTASVSVLTAMEKANAITLVAVNGGLTVQQYLIGLLTGKFSLHTVVIGIATKAQIAFNTAIKANPIGLAVAALALLTAGTIALCVAMNRETEEQQHAREFREKTMQSVNELKKSYDNLSLSVADSFSASDAQMSHCSSLTDELFKLTDANGKVDDANRGRAEFILGELNNALGSEYKMTDGVIGKYSISATSI